MAETTQVVNAQITELNNFLVTKTVQDQIKNALPKGMTPVRLIRQTLTLCRDNPKLAGCTPRSVVGGIIKAAELTLELNGVLGQAYLVPRWNKHVGANEATFQVGYRGLLALAFRSGRVASFPLREVFEGDLFEVEYGTAHRVVHQPASDAVKGEPVAYYALCNYRGGGHDFEVMSRAQVEQHRDKYAQDPSGKYSPWVTAFAAMALKTPLRKLAKRCPLTVEFQVAAVEDEYAEVGVSLSGPPLEGTSRSETLAALLGSGPDEPEPVTAPDEADSK